MQTIYKLLAVALVGLVAVSGVAAATGGFSMAAVASNTMAPGYGHGPGDGTGPLNESERALDGSNSPWATGDERLDMLQVRFNLTDSQVQAIRDEVRAMIENDAAPGEIRSINTEMLAEYGVEDPALGPPADGGQGAGPFGHGNGAGHGFGHGPADGTGNGHGAGPHGSADGSCMN
jgi:hypothetical protein